MAVVLGLLLRGDLLAALRAGARPQGARDPARGAAARRLHRPHDLLGPPGHAPPLPLLQRRLAARLPDRDDPAAAARLGLADRRRFWSLSLQALGRPSATPALVDRLWDERRGLFHDEAQPGGLRPDIATVAALAPLALPDLPEEIGRRLVEQHLLSEREFLTPVAPPSVAAGEPSYEPDGGHGPIRRYWRGPTWINTAWLCWLGLRRLGYREGADRMAKGLIGAVEREGLREYYDPRTGKGIGARDFAWSALVTEMAEPDPAAERSYL